jgi:hypothetical protein
MPFQPGQSGNPSGTKPNKPWRAAIDRALARAEQSGDFRDLNKLADKLLDLASTGDLAALREIGDRLDGKPAQAIVGGTEDDNPLRVLARVERVIIDPKAT